MSRRNRGRKHRVRRFKEGMGMLFYNDAFGGLVPTDFETPTSGPLPMLPPAKGVDTKKDDDKKAKTYSTGTYYRNCDHVQDPFKIGDRFLLVTASTDLTKAKLGNFTKHNLVYPDMGVYMDSGWKYKLEQDPPPLPSYPSKPTPPTKPNIEVYGSGVDIDLDLSDLMGEYEEQLVEYEKALERHEKAVARYEERKKERDNLTKEYLWPFLFIDWPDRGIIDVNLADRVVKYMLKEIKAGKILDTGCMGAHGRTGTLLAMLLIEEEGLAAGAAIEEVRARHCNRAIESDSQVRAIFGFDGRLATEADVKKYR